VLEAVADSIAGTVTLDWTPYAGDQPFSAYVVQRNIADRVAINVLDTLLAADQTSGLIDRGGGDLFIPGDHTQHRWVGCVIRTPNRSRAEPVTSADRSAGVRGGGVRLCAEEDGIRPSGEVLLKGNPAWAAA
jgi:hypothetical protein